MYIHGSFWNKQQQEIEVYILTNSDKTDSYEVGETTNAAGDVMFYFDASEAVSIDCEINDTFDVVISHSATIKLQARSFPSDLFTPDPKNAIVNIFRNGNCLFAGFIDPQNYSQTYNEVYDTITINCLDVLSVLDSLNFRDVSSSDSYTLAKSGITTSSFQSLILEAIENLSNSTDITGNNTCCIYYDNSKEYTADSPATFLSDLYINEELFIGDDEDDVWTWKSVLEEMLKYTNLHIIQTGFAFYIYDWRTLKNGTAISWTALTDVTDLTETPSVWTLVDHDKGDSDILVADRGMKRSQGTAYTYISLTCSIESIDNLIESPLDEDDLVSNYSKRQKYMTEYIHETNTAHTKLRHWYYMALADDCPCSDGIIRDWYAKIMTHPYWTFYISADVAREDIDERYGTDGTNQQKLLRDLPYGMGCAPIQFGSVTKYTQTTDNSVSAISMETSLVLSVNGNGETDEDSYYPTDDDIYEAYPVAVYEGSTSVNLTPASDDITNYIILSGSIVLVPRWPEVENWQSYSSDAEEIGITEDNIDSTEIISACSYALAAYAKNNNYLYYLDDETNDKQYFLSRRPWAAESPKDNPETDDYDGYQYYPKTDEMPTLRKFAYSAIGDSTDTISKVSVVACMLRVGDKVAVETGTDGQATDFVWQDYKSLEDCDDDLDEYFSQCIFIGFDPAIDDYLIGTEFDFQNNITADLNIDEEGIAIPITADDEVSGGVHFEILGVVNVWWDEVTRRHKTWFRHTKWTSTSIPLMAEVSSVMIKNFEIKVVSDNGGVDVDEDNDLKYVSDTDETAVEKKEDIEFKINSALTADECEEYGVASTINISTPLTGKKGSGILSITDLNRESTAKPEQLYVDAYYNEYHKLRTEIEQNIEDEEEVSFTHHITHPDIGEMFITGISRNLDDGTATIKAKEIDEWE